MTLFPLLWHWIASPHGLPYAIVLLALLGVGFLCALSRLWVHLAIWLIYMAAVIFVVSQVQDRAASDGYLNGRPVRFVARRELAANRRLTETDYEDPKNLPLGYFWHLPRKDELNGRYLAQRVPAGGDIATTSLLVAPVLSPNAWLLSIATPELKQSMNAGATVLLCAAEHDCLPGVVAVEAMVCAPEMLPGAIPQTPCFVALAPLNSEQEKAITAAKSTVSRYTTILPVTLP